MSNAVAQDAARWRAAMRDTLNLRLTYAFDVTSRPARGKTESSKTVRSWTEVDVPNLSGADAPIAVELRWPDRSRKRPLEVFRRVGDFLMRPLGDEQAVSPEVFLQDIRRISYGSAFGVNHLWGRGTYPITIGGQSALSLPTWEEAFEGSTRKILSSNQDQNEADAKTLLSERLAIIDGEVWSARSGTEPRIIGAWSDEHGSLPWPSLTLAAPQRGYLSPSESDDDSVGSFRLDRLDDAMRFGRDLTPAYRHHELGHQVPEIITLDPQALRRDDLAELAKWFVENARTAVDDELSAMRRDREDWYPNEKDRQTIADKLFGQAPALARLSRLKDDGSPAARLQILSEAEALTTETAELPRDFVLRHAKVIHRLRAFETDGYRALKEQVESTKLRLVSSNENIGSAKRPAPRTPRRPKTAG